MTKRLLKTAQAAEYLSCSPWKLRELVRDEKIPHVILGEDDSVWRFDVLDLDKFIDSRRQTGF
jgi:excisionase family DNA binding protein